MKQILLTICISGAVISGFAQGAIDVGNNFGATIFRAPIFGYEPGLWWRSVSGQANSAPTFPLGGTTYTGSRLGGPGFSFGFYASTTGITTDERALSLIGTLAFGSGGTAGFVTTTTMNVPGVPAGSQTTYQIRVWDNQGGTITSWEQVDTSGIGFYGKSQLVNSAPLGGLTPNGPVLNAATTGWSSFNTFYIPEPATYALAGLGVAGLLLRRRCAR